MFICPAHRTLKDFVELPPRVVHLQKYQAEKGATG